MLRTGICRASGSALRGTRQSARRELLPSSVASSSALPLSSATPSFSRQRDVRYKSSSSNARRGVAVAGAKQPVAKPATADKGKARETSEPIQEAAVQGETEAAPAADFSASSSQRYAKEDRLPLPMLSAPLGVEEAPSSHKLTWAERQEQQFDHAKRMKKRKAIVKEATRGYFHDFHAMRSHGGKTWLAPDTMIKQDRALYFPNVEGTLLSDKSKVKTADMLYGKVSIVVFTTSQVSELHVKSFYDPTLEQHKGDTNLQLVQINLQENILKAYLIGLFISTLRRQVPESLHQTYVLSHQDLLLEREPMRLDNKHVGYTYLVGPDGKIRWAGCGFADKREQQALAVCTGVLLNRMKSGTSSTTAATDASASQSASAQTAASAV